MLVREQTVPCSVCRGSDGTYYGCEFCPTDAWPKPVVMRCEIVGSVPCGCGHCGEFDLAAGDLIRETYVGVGKSQLDAINDAMSQCHERHPRAEIWAECCEEIVL